MTARLPEARELHTALDHSRCMIPCSLTLSLDPRSLRSSRLSLTRARVLAPAMLSWQGCQCGCRGLTRQDLYKEAEKGMWPLSWGDLLPHADKRIPAVVAEPIETIAQEELSQQAELLKIQQRAPRDYAQRVFCYRKAR